MTTAFSAGGRRAASCSPLNPPQEIPIIPTLPSHHGWRAIQAITASPSESSCSEYSSSKSPSESPVPATSTRTQAYPAAANTGWVVASRGAVPSRLR